MKNTMKVLLCLLALLMTTTFWVSAAEGNGQYTYEVGDTVYTVEFEDSALSAEQQEAVIQRLLGGEDTGAQTYGLGCILFGHDLKESVVSVITHKVFKYSPRCTQDFYDVTICEDCDYQTQEKTGTSYIDCCPEE